MMIAWSLSGTLFMSPPLVAKLWEAPLATSQDLISELFRERQGILPFKLSYLLRRPAKFKDVEVLHNCKAELSCI